MRKVILPFFFGLLIVMVILVLRTPWQYREEIVEFGNLKVGDPAPYGMHPGDRISSAYEKVAPSSFYVSIYQNDERFSFGCFFDECGISGSLVGTMGGWLSGEFIPPDDLFGKKTTTNGAMFTQGIADINGGFSSGERSLIIVADKNSKIVGLYPDHTMDDLEGVLRNHPNLADFSLLEGIAELEPLKRGEPFPSFEMEELGHVYKDDSLERAFSIYVIWNEPSGPTMHCAYECGYYMSQVVSLGGWYYEIDHEQNEVIDRLGLDSGQVYRGEVTLIVLTDAENKILAIHPNKIVRDVITVLGQHPELVDLGILYGDH